MHNPKQFIMACASLALLIAASILPRCSRAAEPQLWLVTTVHSYHYERKKDHEENNWGVGLEYSLGGNWSLTGGGYRNSYGDRSYYAGTAWMPLHYGYFHFGVAVGGVTGYDKPLGAYFIPTMAIQGKSVGLNVGVVPSASSPFTVIGFQLKFRLR